MKYRIVKIDGRKCTNSHIARLYEVVWEIQLFQYRNEWYFEGWRLKKRTVGQWYHRDYALSERGAYDKLNKLINPPRPMMETTVVWEN